MTVKTVRPVVLKYNDIELGAKIKEQIEAHNTVTVTLPSDPKAMVGKYTAKRVLQKKIQTIGYNTGYAGNFWVTQEAKKGHGQVFVGRVLNPAKDKSFKKAPEGSKMSPLKNREAVKETVKKSTPRKSTAKKSTPVPTPKVLAGVVRKNDTKTVTVTTGPTLAEVAGV